MATTTGLVTCAARSPGHPGAAAEGGAGGAHRARAAGHKNIL